MFNSKAIYKAANLLDLSEYEDKSRARDSKLKLYSFEEAMNFYELAITSARKVGFQYYEALGKHSAKLTCVYLLLIAIKRTGALWALLDNSSIKTIHSVRSHALIVYARWGASAKSMQLRECISMSLARFTKSFVYIFHRSILIH